MSVGIVILDYAQEIESHNLGFARVVAVRGSASDTRNRGRAAVQRSISLHEFIAENAEAVAAEMAVAQYFGIKNYKPTLNTFKSEADVASKIEVKWTKYQHGTLIITDADRDQDVAILVIGKSPVYRLAGWLPVPMAKQAQYYNRQYKSYWVTQRDLFPIEDLRRSIHGRSLD